MNRHMMSQMKHFHKKQLDAAYCRELVSAYRNKYPEMAKAIKLGISLDTEYICSICGDELDEYGNCYTCSGPHND